jgi:hypothetical protein
MGGISVCARLEEEDYKKREGAVSPGGAGFERGCP